MSRSRSALRVGIGGALAGALGLVHSASGQDGAQPAGLRLVVDYSLGLDVDTNQDLSDPTDGTYSAIVNGFDFAILSDTRNESFALAFGTELRIADDPTDPQNDGAEFEWKDPAFDLRYSRQAANARVAASANYLRRDVDTVEPFFIDLDGDTIVDETGFEASQGTQTNVGASVTLETGIDAPIGTTYSASYSSRTYNDTTDPDLYDRYQYRFATSTSLRFSEISVGRIDLNLNQYEYSGGRILDGESISVRAGLNQQVSPIFSFDAALGYSKVREEEDIDDETFIDVNQGPNFLFRLTREVDDGSYFATYNRSLVEEVFRNSLAFGRNLSRPRYDLRAEIGLTALDGGDPSPTFGLVYTRPLDDGRFSASLRQTVTVNTEDDERVLTSALLGYSYEINDLSSVNFSFDYAMVTTPGGDETENDQTRATFLASYSHALTREWDLSVGYRGRARSRTDEDAFSNAVFLNVGRRLILRR